MEYSRAATIRGSKLSSLIADRLASGGSIGGSIRGAMSEKMKARATGLKEKFDPLNIARVVTGGSRLGPAVLGRLLGRSRADIKYFSGGKTKQIGRRSSSIGKEPGQYDNETYEKLADKLNSIYSLLRTSRERDLRLKEIERGSLEEKRNEDERRHQEFLEVLKEFVGTRTTGTATPVAKEQGGGFLDMLKSLQEQFTKMLSEISEKIKTLFDMLSAIPVGKAVSWAIDGVKALLANPVVAAMLGIGAMGAAASWFATMVASDPNFQKALLKNSMLGALSGGSALPAGILNVAAKDEREKKLNDGANSVKNLLLEGSNFLAKPYDVGARSYLMRERGLSAKEAEFLMPGNPLDEEKFGSIDTREKMLKDIQDKFYTSKNNMMLQKENEEQRAEFERVKLIDEGSKAAFGVRPRGIKPAPPPPPPIVQLSNMNQDLEMAYDAMGGAIGPVVMNQQSTTNTKDKPMPSTPKVRDDTLTLKRLFRFSTVPQ